MFEDDNGAPCPSRSLVWGLRSIKVEKLKLNFSVLASGIHGKRFQRELINYKSTGESTSMANK